MSRQVEQGSRRTGSLQNERPADPRTPKTSGPRVERRTSAGLSHAQAAEMLVDFELGRLSARRSSAVEQHVRSCEICQKMGLGHAVTERREIIRRLDRVRPTRRIFSSKARGVLLVLAIALLFELVVFELLTPNSTLHQLLGTSPSTAPSPTQTPTVLIIQRDSTHAGRVETFVSL